MAFSITVPETHQESKLVDGKEDTFTIYHVNIRGGNVNKTVMKRFHDFRQFDEGWKKVYPHLNLTNSLPGSIVLFKNSPKVIAERQAKLQSYMQETGKVACLQEFLSSFLEVPVAVFGKRELSSIINTQASAILPGDEKGVKKGNNDEASRKAHADKEAFMKQHAGLLESLLPGRQVNIATTRDTSTAKAGALGNVLVSIWYSPSLAQLHVFVHEATDLPSMDSNGFSDPYIKMYLKPDPEKVTKRKSRVHPRTLNPKFFEEFFWDLPQGELASKRLEVDVWNHNLHLNHNFIGSLYFALSDVGHSNTRPEPKWYQIQKAQAKVAKGQPRTKLFLQSLLGKKVDASTDDTSVRGAANRQPQSAGIKSSSGPGHRRSSSAGSLPAPTPTRTPPVGNTPTRGAPSPPTQVFTPKPPAKIPAAPSSVGRTPAPPSRPSGSPPSRSAPITAAVSSPPSSSSSSSTSSGAKQQRCIHDFPGESDSDLPLRVGDIITVTNSEDPDWWEGECNGARGIFPVSYTEAVKSFGTLPPRPTSAHTRTQSALPSSTASSSSSSSQPKFATMTPPAKSSPVPPPTRSSAATSTPTRGAPTPPSSISSTPAPNPFRAAAKTQTTPGRFPPPPARR